MATPTPPRCASCNDAGWLRLDVPVGHPDFGKAVRCACQREADARRAFERARAASNMTPELERCTFDTFDATRDAEALALVRRWVATRDGWLYLWGAVGTGKTHLAAAAWGALAAQDPAAAAGGAGGAAMPLYVLVPSMLDWMRDAFNVKQREGTTGGEYSTRFNALCQTPILMLDDLGAERQTEWVAEQMFRLVDHRYTSRLPTLFCSNIAPEDLTVQSGMDRRIVSRLQDRAFVRDVEMRGDGGDRRLDAPRRAQDERRKRGAAYVPWWLRESAWDHEDDDGPVKGAQA